MRKSKASGARYQPQQVSQAIIQQALTDMKQYLIDQINIQTQQIFNELFSRIGAKFTHQLSALLQQNNNLEDNLVSMQSRNLKLAQELQRFEEENEVLKTQLDIINTKKEEYYEEMNISKSQLFQEKNLLQEQQEQKRHLQHKCYKLQEKNEEYQNEIIALSRQLEKEKEKNELLQMVMRSLDQRLKVLSIRYEEQQSKYEEISSNLSQKEQEIKELKTIIQQSDFLSTISPKTREKFNFKNFSEEHPSFQSQFFQQNQQNQQKKVRLNQSVHPSPCQISGHQKKYQTKQSNILKKRQKNQQMGSSAQNWKSGKTPQRQKQQKPSLNKSSKVGTSESQIKDNAKKNQQKLTREEQVKQISIRNRLNSIFTDRVKYRVEYQQRMQHMRSQLNEKEKQCQKLNNLLQAKSSERNNSSFLKKSFQKSVSIKSREKKGKKEHSSDQIMQSMNKSASENRSQPSEQSNSQVGPNDQDWDIEDIGETQFGLSPGRMSHHYLNSELDGCENESFMHKNCEESAELSLKDSQNKANENSLLNSSLQMCGNIEYKISQIQEVEELRSPTTFKQPKQHEDYMKEPIEFELAERANSLEIIGDENAEIQHEQGYVGQNQQQQGELERIQEGQPQAAQSQQSQLISNQEGEVGRQQLQSEPNNQAALEYSSQTAKNEQKVLLDLGQKRDADDSEENANKDNIEKEGQYQSRDKYQIADIDEVGNQSPIREFNLNQLSKSPSHSKISPFQIIYQCIANQVNSIQSQTAQPSLQPLNILQLCYNPQLIQPTRHQQSSQTDTPITTQATTQTNTQATTQAPTQTSKIQQAASTQTTQSQQAASTQTTKIQQPASTQTSKSEQAGSTQTTRSEQAASTQTSKIQQAASTQTTRIEQTASTQTSTIQQTAAAQTIKTQQLEIGITADTNEYNIILQPCYSQMGVNCQIALQQMKPTTQAVTLTDHITYNSVQAMTQLATDQQHTQTQQPSEHKCCSTDPTILSMAQSSSLTISPSLQLRAVRLQRFTVARTLSVNIEDKPRKRLSLANLDHMAIRPSIRISSESQTCHSRVELSSQQVSISILRDTRRQLALCRLTEELCVRPAAGVCARMCTLQISQQLHNQHIPSHSHHPLRITKQFSRSIYPSSMLEQTHPPNIITQPISQNKLNDLVHGVFEVDNSSKMASQYSQYHMDTHQRQMVSHQQYDQLQMSTHQLRTASLQSKMTGQELLMTTQAVSTGLVKEQEFLTVHQWQSLSDKSNISNFSSCLSLKQQEQQCPNGMVDAISQLIQKQTDKQSRQQQMAEKDKVDRQQQIIQKSSHGGQNPANNASDIGIKDQVGQNVASCLFGKDGPKYQQASSQPKQKQEVAETNCHLATTKKQPTYIEKLQQTPVQNQQALFKDVAKPQPLEEGEWQIVKKYFWSVKSYEYLTMVQYEQQREFGKVFLEEDNMFVLECIKEGTARKRKPQRSKFVVCRGKVLHLGPTKIEFMYLPNIYRFKPRGGNHMILGNCEFNIICNMLKVKKHLVEYFKGEMEAGEWRVQWVAAYNAIQ